ncbi:MAG: hypothetical protein U0361_15445 [Nitrospiraceae bacterium]
MPASEQAKAANKAVWEMVEPYDGFERWVECARRARCFPSEGQCLLVDYKDCTGSANVRDYFGHAVYTRVDRMLFTLNETVSALRLTSGFNQRLPPANPLCHSSPVSPTMPEKSSSTPPMPPDSRHPSVAVIVRASSSH